MYQYPVDDDNGPAFVQGWELVKNFLQAIIFLEVAILFFSVIIKAVEAHVLHTM